MLPHNIIDNNTATSKACMLAKTISKLSPCGALLADHTNMYLIRIEHYIEAIFKSSQARPTQTSIALRAKPVRQRLFRRTQ